MIHYTVTIGSDDMEAKMLVSSGTSQLSNNLSGDLPARFDRFTRNNNRMAWYGSSDAQRRSIDGSVTSLSPFPTMSPAERKVKVARSFLIDQNALRRK